MAAGEIGMWHPTSATLQQLEHAPSLAEIRERLSPGRLGDIDDEELAPEVTRIVMPAGGGIAGQPVCAYLVGRRRHVLIDPGDPTGPSLDRARALVTGRGGSIEAIALTQVDPDHAGGAEALAVVLGIPVLTGPGGGARLPYAVQELADRERVAGCDVPLQGVHAPGPRPEHLAYIVGTDDAGFVVAGDLDGRLGDRAITAATDEDAARASRDRLRTLAPRAVWLPGHPA
jgi:glyoxylase-like metal-dependent hydrolase (beta-lactamase superfamily II)